MSSVSKRWKKGLPPPPGLDRLAARSLQKLKDDVQWLEIQPLTHKPDDYAMWLRLWLGIGTITVALILTGRWTRLTHLVRRQWMRPWYLDGEVNVYLNPRQREFNGVAKSAGLRSHGLSQTTATGIELEETLSPLIQFRRQRQRERERKEIELIKEEREREKEKRREKRNIEISRDFERREIESERFREEGREEKKREREERRK